MNPHKRAARARRKAKERGGVRVRGPYQQERQLEFFMILTTHFKRIGKFQGSESDFDALVRDLSCGECTDFLQGFCGGKGLNGVAVMDCMNEKLNNGEMGVI